MCKSGLTLYAWPGEAKSDDFPGTELASPRQRARPQRMEAVIIRVHHTYCKTVQPSQSSLSAKDNRPSDPSATFPGHAGFALARKGTLGKFLS